ncbi:SpoIIE family protein phosphatase [Nonomuraea aridisoli]|uniref:protein-serine/threonine phosphatase n=1 Tax=Nonomuraea aridisoli TaxID=2070368 RepID=A0A2W2EVV1_9ACTN|nr:SpoIIE family protein phosphatase [Nonomuraea aridisoli]PZG13507.1 serine/threonine protein phosphatase [Nonomuraea aridisoli]
MSPQVNGSSCRQVLVPRTVVVPASGRTEKEQDRPYGAEDQAAPAEKSARSPSRRRARWAAYDPGLVCEVSAEDQQRFLQRYRNLVRLQSEAVWVTDSTGAVSEPSVGWQRLTGQSWEEHRGHGWLSAVHPDDRASAKKIWVAAVERQSELDQVYRLRRPNGDYRHVRVRGIPIVDGGEIVEWVGTIADIEQEWQERRHRLWLDQVAAATVNLADLEEVLRALADVIVPNLADGCGIYVLPEIDDQPVSLPLVAVLMAGIVPEGAKAPARQEVFDADSDFVTAVKIRRPVHRTFPKGSPPPGSVPPAVNGEPEVNSFALVPLVVDGAVAAVVHAVVVGDREPLSAADIELLGRMLDHARPHLSNAMRFQRTQRVALALQKYLLPDPPRVPGLEITARYCASATAAEIGGDWYDSFVLPDGSMVLAIGDVAGHDLTAAVTMSQVRNALRGLAIDRREPPGDILRRLNVATEILYPEDTGTCVLARLEEQDDRAWQLHYSVAGHPPPLLVTHDGAAHYLEEAVNPVLGVGYDMPRASSVAMLPPGSTLLLYTDGLVEVPGEHLDAGLERLRRAAADLARASLDAFCDELLCRLPMARKDDIAVIAVRLPDT